MNKTEIIEKLYGQNLPFFFDSALPQTLLNNITEEAARHFPDLEEYSKDKKEYKQRVYNTILFGCVFAYDKNGNGSGLLPLTRQARTELQCSSFSNYIFVPVVEEILKEAEQC
jgi:hypothetical protein